MHKGCKFESSKPTEKMGVLEDARRSGSEGLRQSSSQSSLTTIPAESVDSRLGDGDPISKNKTQI